MSLFLLPFFAAAIVAVPILEAEQDGTSSRKILGSSVVTSVSVIMDAGGAQTHFSDAVGRPVAKPHTSGQVASPIDLLNPDRYEFYTFDDNGDLIKRLMTLDEIQGIIASSDGELLTNYNAQQAVYMPEKKVNDVVNNVQNVLKEEIESRRNNSDSKPLLDTPDVSATWSMILPAIFGNSGEDIQFEQSLQQAQQTPETIVFDNTIPPTKRPLRTTTTVLESSSKILSQLITHAQTEKSPGSLNLDTPIITVAIVSRRPTPTGSLNDGTEQYSSSVKPVLDEETTNKFLQLFKPLTTTQQHHFVKIVPTTSTEVPNKYLAVFLPQNTVENTKTNVDDLKVPPSTKQPLITTTHIMPTTFRPTYTNTKGDITRKPSPFKRPVLISTTEPVLIRKPSQSPLNTLPSTLTDYVKQKLTTHSVLPSTTAPVKKNPSPGAQFIVQDEFIKTTTANKRKVPILLSSTTPVGTTTPKSVQIIPNEAFISSYYGGSTLPSQYSSTVNINKVAFNTHYPSTATPILETIANKLTTHSILPSTIAPGAQFIVQDEFIKSTTPNKRKVPVLLSSTIPLGTTTPKSVQNKVISSYYDGSTLPSQYISTINKNKVVFNTHYPSTATQVLETITSKVHAASTAILDKIAGTTLAEPTETTFADVSTTIDYDNIAQQGSTEAQLAEITVPVLLDKLLLTSTNIYNLNNELFVNNNKQQMDGTTTPYMVVPTEKDLMSTTTDRIETTTELTEPNLMASIEELIAQTMNAPNNDVNRGDVAVNDAEESSTIVVPTEHGVSTFDLLINESVDSLLSQVVHSDRQTLTTLSDFVGTTDDLMKRTIPGGEISTINQTDLTLPSDLTTELHVSGIDDGLTAKFVESTTSFDEADVIFTNKNLELLKTEASSYQSFSKNQLQTTEEIADATEIFTKLETTTVGNQLTDSTTLGDDITTPTTYYYGKVPTVTTKPSILTNKPFVSTIETTANESDDTNWKLVSIVAPNNHSSTASTSTSASTSKPAAFNQPKPVELVPQPLQGFSLEDTTATLDKDVGEFVLLCNELAFGFWNSVTTGISAARSVFVSPFAATSLLAMVFLGARGSTSGEMNEILRLDDMVTFNPHLIFRNVSESIVAVPRNGIATSVIARELYSDRSKGQLLNFYKERARQFYEGHVEEVSFKEIGDVIRRRTNLIVKRETNGRIPEFVKDSSFTVRPPLAGVSISIFQTDCTGGSTEGRDGELYFVVLPTIRQRRLIPVPATVYRTHFLAGYEPGLDATAVSVGSPNQTVSTIFVIPGQQGIAAPGDGLARLEKHLMESAFKQNSWSRLLNSLIPRPGLEVQIPRFSHRSVINATVALKHMGLKDLFDSDKADLRGLNGVANELYLSDIIQLNNFATCGEGAIGDQHHSEIYPATANRTFRRYRRLRITHSSEEGISSSEDDDLDLDGKPLASASALVEALYLADEPRDYQRAFHDPLHDPSLLSLPLSLRPRQARIPEPPRLRFDRPFLYFVRHNPTGLVLHMGRFNPRLLP